MKRVVNDTDHHINIKVFGTDSEFLYEIAANDTLEIKGRCFSGHQSYCSIGWTSSFQWIDIIFDQTRILSFSECEDGAASISWDPLQCPGYVSETKDSGYKIYTYIITESDFDSAIPIAD